MKLTKPQELIWDMERFAGDSVAVICASVLKKGHMEESKLQHAINRLFCLNDALRTRIEVDGEQVNQAIAEHEMQHAQVLSFADKAALEAYGNAYALVPIPIRGQLCEMKIVMLPGQYGILVKIHHLIADAWTMALLATQFNMLMDEKEPQAYSYQDYCEKEIAYRNSKRYLRDKEYFLEQIKKCKNPVFMRHQSIGTTTAKRVMQIIQPEKVESIREFANENNLSVFSLFATILAVYISRMNANAENICIGTTVLNRSLHVNEDREI